MEETEEEKVRRRRPRGLCPFLSFLSPSLFFGSLLLLFFLRKIIHCKEKLQEKENIHLSPHGHLPVVQPKAEEDQGSL